MYINRNFMSEKLNNFKKALEEKGLLVAIKSAFNEHVANASVETPAPIVESPVKLSAEVSLRDGSKVMYEGEKLGIGVAVKMMNPDGSSAELLDGEYELADGSKMNVKGGLVESIEAPMTDAEPMPVMDMNARVSALETELKEMKADKAATQSMLSRLEAIEKLSKSTHEGLKTSLSAIDAIIETPAAEPIVSRVKPYEEMTNHEKMLFNKGKL